MNRRSLLLIFILAFSACSSSSASSGGGAGGAATSGMAQIGDPCPNGASDCAEGLACDGADPRGGQCYKACAPSVDADCGDTTKYACSFEGHCYPRCATDDDCRRKADGYVCKDDSPPRPPVKFCDAAD